MPVASADASIVASVRPGRRPSTRYARSAFLAAVLGVIGLLLAPTGVSAAASVTPGKSGVTGTSVALTASTTGAAVNCTAAAWPLWQDYRAHFMQDDGRVVDASSAQMHSSSEGQSYSMFFALIADDQPAFDLLWRWSLANLMGNDLQNTLPAWQWGRAEDGAWRVLDKNSASDADLWFVYALLEAGRIWQRPDYIREANVLLGNIEQREVANLPGLGKMLLPGAEGFVRADNTWRLNPSYMPIPVLRRLATVSPDGPWNAIAQNTAKLFEATTPQGYAADWLGYQATGFSAGGFIIDPDKGDTGSYDAIRTYMWAGMTSKDDPLAKPIITALHGLARATKDGQAPPEKVRTITGQTQGDGPFGFSAALLPYLKASGQNALLDAQRQRVETLQKQTLLPENLQLRRPPYYDYVLTLFSLGWIESRYQFQRNGRLQLLWEKTCPYAATR